VSVPASPSRSDIAGRQQRDHPLVLLAQMTAEVADDILDPIVDPAESRIVRIGGGVVDDRIDQRARGQRFGIDVLALRLVDLLQVRESGLIRRHLRLRDHHPANRQRLLQRADVHPRQMAIGFDIFGAEFVELMGNLARHHRRQNRRDCHQDDQPDGDGKDAFPDGGAQHGSRLGDGSGRSSKSPAERARQVL